MFQYFVLALVAAASADVYHYGACPEVKPVENFDWDMYKGIWYEQAKYPNSVEKFGKCGWAEYTPEGDGIKIRNVHVIDGKEYAIEGSARPAGAKNVGKIYHKFTYGGTTRENLFNVIATDNKNFIIGYYCKYDQIKKGHQDFAWLLTKSKSLEGDLKITVQNYLKESSVIDSSKLAWTDFSTEACTIKN